MKIPRKPCTCNDELYARLLLDFSDKMFEEALMNSLRRLVVWGRTWKRSARGSSQVTKASYLSPAPTRPDGFGVVETEDCRKRRRKVEMKLTNPARPLTPENISKKRTLEKEVERISAKLPELTKREVSFSERFEMIRKQDTLNSGDLKPNPINITFKVGGAARPSGQCKDPVPECDSRLRRHPGRHFWTLNPSTQYCDPYLLHYQAHQSDALAAAAAVAISPSGVLPDLNIPVPAMEDRALLLPPPTGFTYNFRPYLLDPETASVFARQDAAEKKRLESAEKRKARMEKIRQRRQIL